VDEQA
jgi:hypothetical protein